MYIYLNLNLFSSEEECGSCCKSMPAKAAPRLVDCFIAVATLPFTEEDVGPKRMAWTSASSSFALLIVIVSSNAAVKMEKYHKILLRYRSNWRKLPINRPTVCMARRAEAIRRRLSISLDSNRCARRSATRRLLRSLYRSPLVTEPSSAATTAD